MSEKMIRLAPSSVLAFKEAMEGQRGELDAWLECNNEAEVRAHIRAYVAGEMRPLIESLRLTQAFIKGSDLEYALVSPVKTETLGERLATTLANIAAYEKEQEDGK